MINLSTKPVSAGELMKKEKKPINFVVEKFISQGVHFLAGHPKSGKFWLSLWLALCVSNGNDLWGFKTNKSKVLYFCLEDNTEKRKKIFLRLFNNDKEVPIMATVCTPKVKRAQSAKSMGFCLNYVKDRRKTEMANGNVLVSGVRCQPELVYQLFMLTKALAGKNEGRVYYHYVQSFKPDENLSPEHAHKIALERADYFQGFEVVVSTHMDRAHLHSHLIINSVSQETGKKLHLDNKSIFIIRDYSDGLCLNHGLSVLKKSEPNYRIKSMSRGEYRASLRGETVKGSLMRTINEAMRNCNSKAEFTKFMEDKGYEVKWTDSRKNITYTCPDGLKVRDDNLHDERFLKENMQLEFDYRKTKVKEKDMGWEFTHRQEERTINNISEAGQILLNLAKRIHFLRNSGVCNMEVHHTHQRCSRIY